MGNSNQSESNQKKTIKSTYELESQLTFIQKQEEPAYGEFKLMKNNISKQLIAQKTYIMNTEKDKQYVQQKAERLSSLQSKSIVQLLDIGNDEQSELCTKFLKFNLLFEYFPETLENKIKERRKILQSFTEQEIYNFLQSIISALNCMHAQKIFHGDIRPKTILVGQDQICRLTDINTMTNLNSYRQFLMGMKEQCYISPQLVYCLKFRELNPQHSVEKSDVFSLGMICLELASLCNINSCYDFQQFSIKVDRIQEILNIVYKKYSQEMCTLISEMLELQEQQRLNFIQITEKLGIIQQNLEQNITNQKEEQPIQNNDQSKQKSNSIIDESSDKNLQDNQNIELGKKNNDKQINYQEEFNSDCLQLQQQPQSAVTQDVYSQQICENDQSQTQQEQNNPNFSKQRINLSQSFQNDKQQQQNIVYQQDNEFQNKIFKNVQSLNPPKEVYNQLQQIQSKVDQALQTSVSIKNQFNTLFSNCQESISSDDEQEIQRAIEKKKLKRQQQRNNFNNNKNNLSQLKDISNTANQSQTYEYSNQKGNQQNQYQDNVSLHQQKEQYQQNNTQLSNNIDNKSKNQDGENSLYELYLQEYEKIMKEQLSQIKN